MVIKCMFTYIFMTMEPEKHEKIARIGRISNVFRDFESMKYGKITVRLICRVTHIMTLGAKGILPLVSQK